MADERAASGRIALVTGGSRGIGKEIGLCLARSGVDVVVNYFRNRAQADATAAEIQALGRRAWAIKANVGDLDEIAALYDTIEREAGGLDILVSNAASGYNRPAMQQKARGWEWTFNINARSFLFAAQRAAPLMQKRGGGHIVAVSSPGSTRVLPDYVVVGASKAALEALVRYLAVEFSPMNIVVNAVSPGVVETEALEHFDALQDESLISRIRSHTPAGRMVSPGDVAGVVGFLCSPAAAMLRGQVIVVDGGMSLEYYV